MSKKIIVTDLTALAAKFPNLVKMTPAADEEKILAAVALGFALDGVKMVEDTKGNTAPAEGMKKREPERAPQPAKPQTDAEAEAIAASITGPAKLPIPEDITKGFAQMPGETNRTFHQRCQEMRAAMGEKAPANA